jgi:hypothetical protein
MFIRIIAYICVIGLLFIIEHSFGLTSQLGLGGQLEAGVLFSVYLICLYMEIKQCIINKKEYQYTCHRCFIFSFVIGLIWGFLISFLEGHHPYANLSIIVVLIANYILVGILFGLVGILFTKVAWKYRVLIQGKR